MTLEYKILWFEDNAASFRAKARSVKRIVEDLGFIFPGPRNEINKANLETIDFQNYDLIIADLNLANNEKGSEILMAIRDKGVFTEVVFYSSEGEQYVRQELSKFEIDGVYCADRANDDFVDKVSRVIKTTVKKVQDLNNIRGLIMAETSDIDKLMNEIIQKVLEKDHKGIAQQLVDKIYENVGAKVNTKKDAFDKYKGKRIEKIIGDNVMFDAFEKIKAVQIVLDLIEHAELEHYKDNKFKDDYSSITNKRNMLGHETQKNANGKIVVGHGEKAFEFNDDFCIDIRKQVHTHKLHLQQLLSLIA